MPDSRAAHPREISPISSDQVMPALSREAPALDEEPGTKKDRSSLRKLLWPFARARMPMMIAAACLATVVAATQSAILLLFEPVVKVLFPGSEDIETTNQLMGGGPDWVMPGIARIEGWIHGWGITGLATNDPMLTVAAVALVTLCLAIVGSLAVYGYIVLSSWLTVRLVIDLRLQLTKHLMSLSLFYHGRRQLGDLLSRVSADVTATLQSVLVFFQQVLVNFAGAILALGVVIYSAPKLTMYVLPLIPLLALPVMLLAKKVRRRSTSLQTSLGASIQALSQMFQGLRTVKAFRAEEREIEAFKGLDEKYLKSGVRVAKVVGLTQALTVLFTFGGFALLVFAVAYASVRFDLFNGPGRMLTFFFAQSRMYSHVKRLTRAISKINEAAGAARRLQSIFAESSDLHHPAQHTPLRALGSGLRFEGVSVVYPDSDVPALHNFDLEVAPGETVALVGLSGSGKSTAMSLLCRFFDPTAGRITVDGVDLRMVSLDDWTGLFSFVDQSPFLFHTTIGENIRYARPRATPAEIEEAARAADIHEFISSLPQGYDTDVADAGSRLSGGQRQRVTIARAVLKGAPLLLLDEATSSLDSESEAAIQSAIEELSERGTVVVIAHRLSTIKNADKIAVMEGGRLVELGTHAELIGNDGVYTRLVKKQSMGAALESEESRTRPEVDQQPAS